MFRSATYIILVDKGIKGENKRCEVSINCLMRGRAAAKAGRSFKLFFFSVLSADRRRRRRCILFPPRLPPVFV